MYSLMPIHVKQVSSTFLTKLFSPIRIFRLVHHDPSFPTCHLYPFLQKNYQLPEQTYVFLIKFHYLPKKEPIPHQYRLGNTCLRLTHHPNCSSLLDPQLHHSFLLMTLFIFPAVRNPTKEDTAPFPLGGQMQEQKAPIQVSGLNNEQELASLVFKKQERNIASVVE